MIFVIVHVHIIFSPSASLISASLSGSCPKMVVALLYRSRHSFIFGVSRRKLDIFMGLAGIIFGGIAVSRFVDSFLLSRKSFSLRQSAPCKLLVESMVFSPSPTSLLSKENVSPLFPFSPLSLGVILLSIYIYMVFFLAWAGLPVWYGVGYQFW